MPTPLVIFDLDAALPGGTCDLRWSRFLRACDQIDDARLDRCLWVARQYAAGTVVPEDYALAQAALLAGRDLAELRPLLQRFLAQEIRPQVPQAACELLRRHQAAGHTLLMTSASARVLCEAVAAEFGVENVLGTELVWFSGRCTGVLRSVPNMRLHKLARVREWLHARGLGDTTLRQATFYSDSINDLALLSAVGRPVVVDPDPRLAATAIRKRWRTLQLLRVQSGVRGRPAAPAAEPQGLRV